MKYSFWLEKWQKGDIGFHQAGTHVFLRQYWPTLREKQRFSKAQRIFIPLCGKSLDMLWLWKQGCHIQGIELSKIAIQAFFSENKLKFEVQSESIGQVYKYQELQIWQGDFWDLNSQHLGHIDIVYDRAALVALPARMRQLYTQHIQKLAPKAAIFLITIEYKAGLFKGPPFCLEEAAVEDLYAKNYTITILAERQAEVKSFPVREKLYWLERIDAS